MQSFYETGPMKMKKNNHKKIKIKKAPKQIKFLAHILPLDGEPEFEYDGYSQHGIFEYKTKMGKYSLRIEFNCAESDHPVIMSIYYPAIFPNDLNEFEIEGKSFNDCIKRGEKKLKKYISMLNLLVK